LIKSFLTIIIFAFSFSFASSIDEQRLILSQKGVWAYQDKNYTFALKTFKEALLLYDTQNIDRATLHDNIAECYKCLYQPQKAMKHYHQAIEIYKEIAPRSFDLAALYNQLAQLYKSLGNYQNALKNHQKALELKKVQSNPNQPSIATSYNNIGNVYKLMGRYVDALGYYQKALKIRYEILGKEHLLTAQSYNNIAGLYHALGSFDKALEYHQKALNIRKIKSKKLYHSYHNIARTYQRLGKYAKALEFYHYSIASNSDDTSLLWESYNNLAQIYIELGKNKKAYFNIKKALKYKGSLFEENHINSAILYSTLSKYHHKNKTYKKALRFQQKALKIQLETLGKESIETIYSYHTIAKIYQSMGEDDKALKSIEEAINIFLLNQKEHYLVLDEQQKQQYNKHYNALELLSDLLAISVEYQKKHPQNSYRLIAKNFQRWLNYKGNINHHQNSLSIIYHKINQLKNDIDTLKAEKIYLSTLYQTYLPFDDQEAIIKLNKAKAKSKETISQLEIELNNSYKIFQKLLKLQEVDYRTIASHLKANQLYIDFIQTNENYYIFTLDKQQHITFKALNKKETHELDIAIQSFRVANNKIKNKEPNSTQSQHQIKEILKSIYTILNRYLRFQKIKQEYLIVSADGLLNFLPFEALFDGNNYLIEFKNISYIPSGRELLRALYNETSSFENSKIVIFGNPNYNHSRITASNKSTTRSVSIGQELINLRYFKPLRGTLKELETLNKLYPQSHIYQENNATVANLLKIKNPKIFHIATHGFFLKNSHPNLMQQSGLALTGANDAKLYCDTHGIVTALKLSTLQLSQTDLVVLSACDTGIGKIELAQGVNSLSRAFIQAGAKNVIMSLWSVDDNQTANLMIKFYNHLSKSNKQYIDAFREAKLEMIDLHPYYWSGFIFNGAKRQ